MLLIPGFDGLRFHRLLAPYKRQWNTNTEKYAAFWDPGPLLQHLASTPFWQLKTNLNKLRNQLIVCCRLLCLYRSVDLAHIKRTVCVLGGVPFIKIKRKVQKFFKWERVLSIPGCPQISPFHLMQAYVALTKDKIAPGGGLLLALKPPYKPISADTVGSITKSALQAWGLPSQFWRPTPPVERGWGS